MAQERDRHGTAFVVGAALGGVVGAVWGLLNAGETGEQARVGLGRRLDAGADRLVLAAADVEVTARQWLARRELAPRGGESPEFALPDNHEAADAPVAVGGVLPEVEGGGGPDEVIG